MKALNILEPILEPKYESQKLTMPRHPNEEDEQDILSAVRVLSGELEVLNSRFDNETDPRLIDSIIYEMQAVQLRYMYYIDICKERGIKADSISFLSGSL